MNAAAARRSPHGHELPLLERRRLEVVQRLRQMPPTMRYAYDTSRGCLLPEKGPPVSMMLAIRTPDGILTGEIEIPRENFHVDQVVALLEAHGRIA